jgi:hypothetical protein
MSVEQQNATCTDQETNEDVLVEQINRLPLTDKNVTWQKRLVRLHYYYPYFAWGLLKVY